MRFRLLPVRGEPGTRADERIIPDLEWIRTHYKVDLRDAYAPSGHAAGGEHPLGLGVDIVPDARRGGNWDDVDHLAAFAAKHPGVFRFIGYDGRFGTTSWPNHGRGNHLHLSWRHAGTTLGAPGRVPTLTHNGGRARGGAAGPADWLKEAGWPAKAIPIMTAIGGAESGWKVDAVGGPNDNGTYDYGWLQINSVHGFDRERLLSDPVYTARAGLKIYRSQGLEAWSTYNSGAWKSYRGQRPTGAWSRSRPGGEAPGQQGTDPNTTLVGFWQDIDPLNWGKGIAGILEGAADSVNSVTDFLKWIAWIFHPLNILRTVEFLVGFQLILVGIWVMVQHWRGADAQAPMRLLGEAASMTPPGRTLRVARGKRLGKSLARSETRRKQTAKAVKQGRRQETQRQGNRQLTREARQDREDIPF